MVLCGLLSLIWGGTQQESAISTSRSIVTVSFTVSIPNYTPDTSTIYLAGTFNEWDEAGMAMVRLNDTTWYKTLSIESGTEIEYKYTRGTWETVEKDSVGDEIENRFFSVDSIGNTIIDTVASWADIPIVIGPWNIAPILTYYSSNPQTEIALTWASKSPGQCKVHFGLSDLAENEIAVSEHYDLASEGDSLIHVARLAGLNPGMTYLYQVETETVYCSDTLDFTTADYDTGFSFIVAGDNQLDLVPALLDSIQARDPRFMLHTGDLVVDGARLNEWYTFLGRFADFVGHYVMLPVYGNHDLNAGIQRDLFQVPDNNSSDPDDRGHWFSLDYNNLHIIGLDVQRDYESGSDQYIWLENNLANIPASADNIIVYFHQPAYNSSGYHGPNLRVRQTFEPLFIQHGVDLVFSGHNHHYERSLANGITYITTGGLSCWLKDITPDSNPWSVYAEKVNHYCQVDVNGADLTVTMLRQDGTVGDVFKTLKVDGRNDDWLASGVVPLADTDGLQLDSELQLKRLFLTWDDRYFHFGFDVPARIKNVTYGLYFDVDNIPGSGGASDYLGFAIAADTCHLPEVELYLSHLSDDTWDISTPEFACWDADNGIWQTFDTLPDGSSFKVDTLNRFAEITIPREAPGFWGTDSFYVKMFTVGEIAGAGASESIPSDSMITFTAENTSTDITMLSSFYGFNVTEPVEIDTFSLQADGSSADWHRKNIEPLAYDSDQAQAGSEYQMDSLFVHMDSTTLYLGWWSPAEYIGLHYGIYIDTDNIPGSGGTNDKWRAYTLGSWQHRPDVTIYAYHQETGGFSSSSPKYYSWSNNDWVGCSGGDGTLPTGGEFGYSASNDFIEISVPRTSAGLVGTADFYIALFNFGSEKYICETVPSDPAVQYFGENTADSVYITNFVHYNPDGVSIDRGSGPVMPEDYQLFQNYPNPFNASTRITYYLPEAGTVKIALYDICGRQVTELANNWHAAGYHEISLNGSRLASGVYFYRISAGNYNAVRKMVLLK